MAHPLDDAMDSLAERWAREDRERAERAEREAARDRACAEQNLLEEQGELLEMLSRSCRCVDPTAPDPKRDGDFMHEADDEDASLAAAGAHFQRLTERLRAAGLVEVLGPFDYPHLPRRSRRKVLATELGREKLRAAYALLGLPASPAGDA